MSNKYFYTNNLSQEIENIAEGTERILVLKPGMTASEAMRAISSIISRKKANVTTRYVEWVDGDVVGKGVALKWKDNPFSEVSCREDFERICNEMKEREGGQ